MHMQSTVLQHDPRVRVILSDSFSADKFGFVQVNVRKPVEQIVDFVERKVETASRQRKRFFKSKDSDAFALTHSIK